MTESEKNLSRNLGQAVFLDSHHPVVTADDRTELDACSTALRPVGLLIIQMNSIKKEIQLFHLNPD